MRGACEEVGGFDEVEKEEEGGGELIFLRGYVLE